MFQLLFSLWISIQAKAVDDEGLSGSNAGKAVFMNLDQVSHVGIIFFSSYVAC